MPIHHHTPSVLLGAALALAGLVVSCSDDSSSSSTPPDPAKQAEQAEFDCLINFAGYCSSDVPCLVAKYKLSAKEKTALDADCDELGNKLCKGIQTYTESKTCAEDLRSAHDLGCPYPAASVGQNYPRSCYP